MLYLTPDRDLYVSWRIIKHQIGQVNLYRFCSKNRIGCDHMKIVYLYKVAGVGRHPVGVLSFPFDIASDRIGQRSADGSARQQV